jgi:hypothetical protein
MNVRPHYQFAAAVLAVLIAGPAFAQHGPAAERVIRMNGTLPPAAGAIAGAPENVRFAIYDAETGGTLLWEEIQAVALDASGQYSVLLGATSTDGLPVDLFAGGAARWLSIGRAGGPAGPRTLLTAVPYAVAAATATDAVRLGGRPAADFALTAAALERDAASGTNATTDVDRNPTPQVNTGTTGYIGKFVNSIDLTSSVIYEANGRIGVGTGAVTPLDIVHSRFTDASGSLTGLAVQNMSSSASAYSGMLFYDHTGALRQFQGYNNSTGEYRINNIAPGASINFMLGSQSRFLVRPDGNVTIAGSLWNAGGRILHTTGNASVFVGLNAGNAATGVTSFNTAIGTSALQSSTGDSNTATGYQALFFNAAGNNNTASGARSLITNDTGSNNTAVGNNALSFNTAGSNNTGLGAGADVSSAGLQNATAIGAGAQVNASNKIRLGNTAVTVIEGQVAYTFTSDRLKKENFQPVDAEGVLQKLRQVGVTSWNYIGQDATTFRHYGPMAQDFYAAFGHDGVGSVGTATTINSGDEAGILMLAVQALEARTAEHHARETQLRQILQAQQQRIEALEQRLNDALATRK